MIKVYVKKQGNYPVSAKKVRDFLKELFAKKGIVSRADASVLLVGEKRMLAIGRKYLRDNKIHNVLSFTQEETGSGFVSPPDGIIHLGEIVVCYPVAFNEAKKEGKLIEEKVFELIEHGALHLLGIHHE